MAPVKVLDPGTYYGQAGGPGGRMIRCVIIGARPARDLTASFQSIEGSPEYDFIAFDASGEKRSRKVTISHFWLTIIRNEFDSDLDIRSLMSNRDEVMGIALSSRKYFALARRAVDPTGALGFFKPGESLPDDSPAVSEGALIRYLKNPPTASTGPQWAARIQEDLLSASTQMAKARIPAAHLMGRGHVPPSQVAEQILNAIARERRHSLSRTGYDQKAVGILVFLLDLAVVKHSEPPTGNTAADMLFFEGQRFLDAARRHIDGASPGMFSHCDGPKAMQISLKYMQMRDSEQPIDFTALNKEYEAAVRDARSPDGLCRAHNEFCPDPSDLAAVILDVLPLTEALYKMHGESLANALLSLLSEPVLLNFRKNDRVNLRDRSFKLLVHLLSPDKPAADLIAGTVRETLSRSFLDAQDSTALRAIFNAAGWGSEEELKITEEELFSAALRPHIPQWAEISAAHLHAISQLQNSNREPERNAAQRVRKQVAELQARKAKPKPQDGLSENEERFLQLWETLEQKNKPNR